MYATGTRHMAPPIDMFGDASPLLSVVSANGRPAGAGLAGREAVVSFGAFALPSKTSPWELWALRRKSQVQVMRSVVEVGPTAAVIALEVAHDRDFSKARALGRRLAEEVPYVSKTRYGHRLPTVVVIVRGREGRERLAAKVLRGHFHGSQAYREVVIDADDLLHPGRHGGLQVSAA